MLDFEKFKEFREYVLYDDKHHKTSKNVFEISVFENEVLLGSVKYVLLFNFEKSKVDECINHLVNLNFPIHTNYTVKQIS